MTALQNCIEAPVEVLGMKKEEAEERALELLELVDKSDFIYVLETNGMTIGHDSEFAKELSRFRNLHVRVSIKGCNKEEYIQLTGAMSSSYDLPYLALYYLMKEEVSCNVCLSISFSSPENIKKAEKRLYDLRPGLLKSLEKEHITLFPKVYNRLKKLQMMPNTHRFAGKVIKS